MKPILVPLPVPWQIASGAASLRLEAWEEGSGQPTRIRFHAFFRPLRITRAEGNSTTHSGAGTLEEDEGEYHEVEIVFRSAYVSRFLPAYSDSEVIQEDAYDWSRIDVDYSIADGIEEFRRRFWETWRRTGQCPDPSAYTIELSDWLPEYATHPYQFQHFMFCANDNYIEVLALDYTWGIKAQ